MITLKEAFQFIASADEHATWRLVNAINRRKRDIPPGLDISPGQAKTLFREGSYFEIAHCTNEALNGVIGKVISVSGKALKYSAGDDTGIVDIRCAIPVDTAEAEGIIAEQKPIANTTSYVLLHGGGKFGGAHGVIVKSGKAKFSVVLVDSEYAGAVINAPHLSVEAMKHERQPHLTVYFKEDIPGRDPDGTVRIVDTAKVKDLEFLKTRSVPEELHNKGVIGVSGWLKYSEAHWLAKGLGAAFEVVRPSK
jgi:hypothetical protein